MPQRFEREESKSSRKHETPRRASTTSSVTSRASHSPATTTRKPSCQSVPSFGDDLSEMSKGSGENNLRNHKARSEHVIHRASVIRRNTAALSNKTAVKRTSFIGMADKIPNRRRSRVSHREPSVDSLFGAETLSMASGNDLIGADSFMHTTTIPGQKTHKSQSDVQLVSGRASNRFIVMPDSTLRMRWDMGILVLVLYFGISVPMRMAFVDEDDEEDPFVTFIDWFAIVIFLIDMVLNFRTAIKSLGVIVTDPKKIAWNYITTWFFIDLVATIPIDSMLGDSAGLGDVNKILRLLRIFKLFRVFRISRILGRIEEATKFNPSMIRLIKLFLTMCFSWHWIACLYWFISDLENFGFIDETYSVPSVGFNRELGNQWVPPPELWCRPSMVSTFRCNETAFISYENEFGYNPFKGINYCIEMGHCTANFDIQYANSFFWAVMVTTGIGRDIVPVTWVEHFISTIMILLGVLMYAVIIGSASSALSSLDSDSTEKRTKLESINEYMRQRNVPHSLRKRIREFYEYMWSSHQSLDQDGGIMSELHETLRLQLHIALNRKLILSIPMFKEITDSSCLIDIIERLKPKIFIPGEFICLAGEEGREMFIMVRGTVHVFSGSDSKLVASISDGQVFGEQSLIMRQKRNASVRAITYCETLVLNSDDFEEVIMEYPAFSQSLQRITTRHICSPDDKWGKLRETLRMCTTVRAFDGAIDLRDLLLNNNAVTSECSSASFAEH